MKIKNITGIRLIYVGNNFMVKTRVSNYSFGKGEFKSYSTALDAYLEMVRYKDAVQTVVFYDQTSVKKDIVDFSKLIKSDSRFLDTVVIHLDSNIHKYGKIDKYVDDAVDVCDLKNDYDVRLKFLLEYSSKQGRNFGEKNIKDYSISVAKRAFDVCFSLVALIILSPLFLITILALKIESRGPVFYSSKRVGSGYKIFDFYKFRSMYLNADKLISELKKTNNQYAEVVNDHDEDCPDCKKLSKACSPMLYVDNKKVCENSYRLQLKSDNDNAFVKIKDDPRVTRVGKLIRNLSIDELPQLVNVL